MRAVGWRVSEAGMVVEGLRYQGSRHPSQKGGRILVGGTGSSLMRSAASQRKYMSIRNDSWRWRETTQGSW